MMNNKQAYFDRLLELCGKDETKKKEYIKEAYKVALDTRKFEIELYWKRATYFWAFIVAIFVAYFAAQKESLEIIAVALALLGFLFSLGWNMVARGSKVWQENWEMHIGYLEEEIHGPLFKTFSIPKIKLWSFQQEYPFSVSKVNQVLSLFTCLFWFGIFGYSLNEIFPERWKFITIKQESILYFILFILIFIMGVILLNIKSKSFQYQDLDSKNEGNYLKFYHDTDKKEGGFYYKKRDSQRSILDKAEKKNFIKSTCLDFLLYLFRK